MTVPAFLTELRHRDIRVWAEGDRLRCNAPAGVLTPGLHEQLRRRKTEILDFLHSARSLSQQHRAIVPLQPRGARAPIFGVPGHNGDVFCYRFLAQSVGEDQPLYGLQPPGLDGQSVPLTRIEDLAAYFAAQIRAFHPSGPCVIAGFCAGGLAAFELGRHLLRERAEVTVALLAAPHPTRYQRFRLLGDQLGLQTELGITWVVKHTRALISLPRGRRCSYVAAKLRRRKERHGERRSAPPDSVLHFRAQVERATLAAARRYTPGRFGGRVGLFAPCDDWLRSRDEPLRWRSIAQALEVYSGPEGCHTDDMLREPYVGTFAKVLRQVHRGSALSSLDSQRNPRSANQEPVTSL